MKKFRLWFSSLTLVVASSTLSMPFLASSCKKDDKVSFEKLNDMVIEKTNYVNFLIHLNDKNNLNNSKTKEESINLVTTISNLLKKEKNNKNKSSILEHLKSLHDKIIIFESKLKSINKYDITDFQVWYTLFQEHKSILKIGKLYSIKNRKFAKIARLYNEYKEQEKTDVDFFIEKGIIFAIQQKDKLNEYSKLVKETYLKIQSYIQKIKNNEYISFAKFESAKKEFLNLYFKYEAFSTKLKNDVMGQKAYAFLKYHETSETFEKYLQILNGSNIDIEFVEWGFNSLNNLLQETIRTYEKDKQFHNEKQKIYNLLNEKIFAALTNYKLNTNLVLETSEIYKDFARISDEIRQEIEKVGSSVELIAEFEPKYNKKIEDVINDKIKIQLPNIYMEHKQFEYKNAIEKIIKNFDNLELIIDEKIIFKKYNLTSNNKNDFHEYKKKFQFAYAAYATNNYKKLLNYEGLTPEEYDNKIKIELNNLKEVNERFEHDKKSFELYAKYLSKYNSFEKIIISSQVLIEKKYSSYPTLKMYVEKYLNQTKNKIAESKQKVDTEMSKFNQVPKLNLDTIKWETSSVLSSLMFELNHLFYLLSNNFFEQIKDILTTSEKNINKFKYEFHSLDVDKYNQIKSKISILKNILSQENYYNIDDNLKQIIKISLELKKVFNHFNHLYLNKYYYPPLELISVKVADNTYIKTERIYVSIASKIYDFFIKNPTKLNKIKELFFTGNTTDLIFNKSNFHKIFGNELEKEIEKIQEQKLKKEKWLIENYSYGQSFQWFSQQTPPNVKEMKLIANYEQQVMDFYKLYNSLIENVFENFEQKTLRFQEAKYKENIILKSIIKSVEEKIITLNNFQGKTELQDIVERNQTIDTIIEEVKTNVKTEFLKRNLFDSYNNEFFINLINGLNNLKTNNDGQIVSAIETQQVIIGNIYIKINQENIPNNIINFGELEKVFAKLQKQKIIFKNLLALEANVNIKNLVKYMEWESKSILYLFDFTFKDIVNIK